MLRFRSTDATENAAKNLGRYDGLARPLHYSGHGFVEATANVRCREGTSGGAGNRSYARFAKHQLGAPRVTQKGRLDGMRVKNVILVSFLLLVLPAAILLASSYDDETINVTITVEKYVDITLNDSVGLSLIDTEDGDVQTNFTILANFPYALEIQSQNRGPQAEEYLPFAVRDGGTERIYYDVQVRTGTGNDAPRAWFNDVGNTNPLTVDGSNPGNTQTYNLLVKSQFQDYAGDLELALAGAYEDTLTVSVVEQ